MEGCVRSHNATHLKVCLHWHNSPDMKMEGQVGSPNATHGEGPWA